jgi:hypothetical protein
MKICISVAFTGGHEDPPKFCRIVGGFNSWPDDRHYDLSIRLMF